MVNNWTRGMDDYLYEIPEDSYLVLGDNRNNSRDSRSPDIGQVDRREILGKAIFLMIPGTDGGKRTRDFGRIGVID